MRDAIRRAVCFVLPRRLGRASPTRKALEHVALSALTAGVVACSGDVSDRETVVGRPDPSTGTTAGGGGGTMGTANGGGSMGANGTDGGDNMGGNPIDACGDGTEALAPGLRISSVAMYQTIKIPLYENGAWVTSRVTSIVQGKTSLVRVFVETLPGWSSHSVRGVLTLDNAGTEKQITADLKPNAASTDNQLSSTFNFEVEGAEITSSTKLSIAVVETSCPDTLGNAADVRIPMSGTQSLNAERIGKLRIVLVPVQLPSGPMPDTNPEQIADMKAAMLAYYPLADVELTVREPFVYNNNIGTSNGWPQLLNALGQLRSRDQPDRDVYYYGLVTPSNTLMQYCGFGCTLGIANQASQPFPQAQVGLGVGFIDVRTYDTMVHEVGHTHGLGHAPCAQGGQISGVENGFPYSGGATGTWGWDLRDNKLHPPTDKDIMGYCSPSWISDYFYKRLMTRSKSVNQRSSLRRAPSTDVWSSIILLADGSASWGASIGDSDLEGAPFEDALVRNVNGDVVDEIEVVRVGLSDRDDAFLYLPQPGSDWATLELSDRRIDLPGAAPAAVQ